MYVFRALQKLPVSFNVCKIPMGTMCFYVQQLIWLGRALTSSVLAQTSVWAYILKQALINIL